MNQGPADLQSAALTTELCTQMLANILENKARMHVEHTNSSSQDYLKLAPNVAFLSSVLRATSIGAICETRRLPRLQDNAYNVPEWLKKDPRNLLDVIPRGFNPP